MRPRQAEPKHAEKGLAKSKAWAQTADITVNGKIARALVDTGADVNVMTKTAAKRLGLRYTKSNAQIRTVNASVTPIVGVAHGVNIMVGDWQGKTKFIIAPINMFDVILGQKFFQQCHAVIDPHLQKLTIMEKGREYAIPMVKAQATEGQARLKAMKLERVDVRRRVTPAATIESSREDNGAGETLPPRRKRVPSRNR